MNDPKVPDNKSDWKSIDIYLFSNGQQSSPPRKYHLVIDQLEWWKVTLNFLAKSQYGSLHSMVDLYTIEGNKVETPMQLSQNMAYVAVLPPDVFIDAGYGRYLIKATRSWEKGQFRRTSNTAVIKPEELKLVNEKSNSDTRAGRSSNSKKREEGELHEKIGNESVILKTIIASMVDNQPSMIVKPAAKDKSYSNSAKQPDKSNRPSIQHTSIAKRNSIFPSPPRSRKPSLKKDTVKISTELTEPSPKTINNHKYQLKGKVTKPIQKQKDSLPETVLTKVEEIVNEIKSNSSLKIVNDKRSETKNTETENLVLEKNDILPPKYDKDNEIDKLITVNHDVSLSNNMTRQDGEHELLYDAHRNTFESTNIKIRSFMANDTDVSMINVHNTTGLSFDGSSMNLSNVAKTENDEAVGNKERVANMKLNIELWCNPNEAKLVPTVLNKKDSMIVLKVEKGSQVDVEDKSYHNKLISKDQNYNEGNYKVRVVNCTCPTNANDETKNQIPVKNGSTNFLIFLPVLKLDEDCKRLSTVRKKIVYTQNNGLNYILISSRNKTEPKENKGTNYSHNSSICYPAEKTISGLSLHKEKLFSHSEQESRNYSTEIQVETNMIHDKNEVASTKRKSVAIKEEQDNNMPLDRTMIFMSEKEHHHKVFVAPEPDKSDVFVLKKESIASILHKSSTKFTQTEWCDVLLEVKLQDDGHYSFHMPTLEMLKHYRL